MEKKKIYSMPQKLIDSLEKAYPKKMSSYQKQKARIAELEKHIYTLIEKEGNLEAELIKIQYKSLYQYQRANWFGSTDEGKGDGIYKAIIGGIKK